MHFSFYLHSSSLADENEAKERETSFFSSNDSFSWHDWNSHDWNTSALPPFKFNGIERQNIIIESSFWQKSNNKHFIGSEAAALCYEAHI